MQTNRLSILSGTAAIVAVPMLRYSANVRYLRRTRAMRVTVKDGDLQLHPIVTKLVDAETLEKTGASKVGKQ